MLNILIAIALTAVITAAICIIAMQLTHKKTTAQFLSDKQQAQDNANTWQQKATEQQAALSAGQKEIDMLREQSQQTIEQLLSDKQQLQTESSQWQQKATDLQANLSAMQKEIDMLLEQQQQDRQRQATIREEETIQRKTEQEKSFNLLREQVENITQRLLKERSEEFNASSEKRIGTLIDPLQEKIAEMKRAMDDAKVEQVKHTASFEQQIRQLMEQTQQMSLSADTLSRALSADTKVQGNWGETVLQSILDAQGLIEGLNYETQSTLRDANGKPVLNDDTDKRMIPDVIIHMDTERDFIIDSKTSLTAFINYQNAENQADKERFLAEHVRSLRKHVDELAKKDYTRYILAPRKSLDFAMMFVPNESALQLALYTDATLWRYGMEKGVFITGEQNLYAALRAVAVTWTNIRQAENHQKVYDLANELMSRLGDFLNKYHDLGERIQKVQKLYDETEKKLTTGQSILSSARKLEKLGAKQDKNHPLPYKDIPDEEDNTPALS